MKKSTIEIEVGLDDQNMPEKISWTAVDKGERKVTEAKAMVLALFDENTKDTFRLDLWTKEMQVIEMDRFMYHTLKSLCNTYENSTRNTRMASAMKQFVQFFGEETEILAKGQDN